MGGRGAEVEEAASPFHILTLYNGTGRFTNPFYQLSEVTRDKQISGVSHFDSLTKPWQVDTPFGDLYIEGIGSRPGSRSGCPRC